MKVKQILNNNVAVVLKEEQEMIVVSKGIAFRKKKGDAVSEAEIDKVYVLDTHEKLKHFSHLISQTSLEDLQLIDDITAYGGEVLGVEVSDYLGLALLDHLNFLLERAKKQQFIKNPLVWEVQRFYPKHFDIGLKSLKKIEKVKKMEIPKDEAVAIALHFVNMENTNRPMHSSEELASLGDIVTIVTNHYGIKLNESSENFLRFITHLKYFIWRMKKRERLEDDLIVELYKQVSGLYPEAFACVQKIRTYVMHKFQVNLSMSEETYLMLHINRVTLEKNRSELK